MKRHLQQALPWLICCAISGSYGTADISTAGGSISVSVRARWNAPPLLEEMLETVAIVSYSDSTYFAALDLALKVDTGALTTSQALYQHFVHQLEDAKLLSGHQIALFKLNLALHTAAPAIQAFYQFYNDSVIEKAPTNCVSWTQLGAERTCGCGLLDQWSTLLAQSRASVSDARQLSFDHAYNSAGTGVVVLYGSAVDASFRKCHTTMLKWSRQTGITYVHRWVPVNFSGDRALHVGGYGVELALKSTEYIVTDDQRVNDADNAITLESPETVKSLHGFNFPELLQRFPEITDELHSYHQVVMNSYPHQPRVVPVSAESMKDFGLKVSSAIMASPVPFETMTNLLQDFPKYAEFLSKHDISPEVAKEIVSNQRRYFVPGTESITLNGLTAEPSRLTIFGLLEAIKIELNAVDILKSLGLSTKQAVKSIAESSPAPSNGRRENSIDVYDIREIWEREARAQDKSDPISGIIWWNNLQKDRRYKTWFTSMSDILRFQGGMPRMRKNLFKVLLMVDISSSMGLNAVSDSLAMIKNLVPIQFGVLPLIQPAEISDSGTSISETVARVLYTLMLDGGKKSASSFVESLHRLLTAPCTLETVKAAYEAADGRPETDFFEVITNKREDVEKYITASKRMASDYDLGFGASKNGGFIINARYFDMDESYHQQLNSAVSGMLRNMQQLVYYGQMNDKTDINEFFLTAGTVRLRRNAFIAVSEDQPLRCISISDDAKIRFHDIKHVGHCGQTCLFSIWIVGDTGNDGTLSLMMEAQNFVDGTLPHAQNASVAVFDSAAHKAPSFATENGGLAAMIDANYAVRDGVLKAIDQTSLDGAVIFVNGRVIGPLPPGYRFTADDFSLLCQSEHPRSLIAYQNLVMSGISSPSAEQRVLYSAASMSLAIRHAELHALVDPGATADQIFRSAKYENYEAKFSSFSVGDQESATVHLVAVLNPLSSFSQKMVSMLRSLTKHHDLIHIRVFLNPSVEALKELPIKRFYRFALPHEPHFDDKGTVRRASIKFSAVPVEPLLTLGTDVPQAWVVMPSVSTYDLDNLRLSSLDSVALERGITAELELKYILVEGHARDLALQTAPRGLQFILGASNKDVAPMDTIVMANLGYFQLKANPGVWDLDIRQGRSREFYSMVGMQGGVLASADGKLDISVTKFEGSLIFVQVRKNASRLSEELLITDSSAQKGSDSTFFADWLPWTGATPDKQAKKINIFSVASGHLYERFLRIMILSVLKHTKTPVKFWFIENFLSPSFKDFIPHMANTYGFEVELVTYKWPQWLRGQTEKQRTIWGYKILFLDVLFPLDLDRVIFVDADQIVRTDLKELVEMDLHGAPYGYTPFCDSRKEIEGFRFWKIGYWKNHLAGKPYHISALYVIDLNRFRGMAAGDRLRQQYHMLSADPNSLSNLDQDLPNDMQHDVPIFSLPQEWLWCETWCDDGSLKTAKTIDLCNNPMTKEPKLERAQRLIPEWKVYDAESRALFDEWRSGAVRIPTQEPTLIKDEL